MQRVNRYLENTGLETEGPLQAWVRCVCVGGGCLGVGGGVSVHWRHSEGVSPGEWVWTSGWCAHARAHTHHRPNPAHHLVCRWLHWNIALASHLVMVIVFLLWWQCWVVEVQARAGKAETVHTFHFPEKTYQANEEGPKTNWHWTLDG